MMPKKGDKQKARKRMLPCLLYLYIGKSSPHPVHAYPSYYTYSSSRFSPRFGAKCYMSLKRQKTSHHAAGPTCRFFFYLRSRAPWSSRVSVAVGGGGGCWRRAARGLAADEVRVRVRGCWGPSPLPATLERGWGWREARPWRRVAGRGGWRLDKRWARDRGRGGDDLPPVTARRISARGSGGRIRRREPPETREEDGEGEQQPSAMLGDFVTKGSSKSAPLRDRQAAGSRLPTYD
jgi:hypothetical protein